MTQKLVAYCLDWHVSASSADDILVDPLASQADVELRPWDGETLSERLPPGEPTVFFMLPPPPEVAGAAGARIVWIPMWDHARIYDRGWWADLPSSLRVVALSRPVFERASGAGLPTLNLRYFLDPACMPGTEWGHGRVACYWNRTGMMSPQAVRRMCEELSLDRLLFREQLDPRIPDPLGYSLPGRLGPTEVISIRPRSRREYLEITREANIFIAPRTSEGVGLTFLEAMARGSCVIGYDAPTMNEYIRDGENGLLFKSSHSRLHPAALGRLARRSPHPVNVDQHWKRLAEADHATLGERARADQQAGHELWLDSLAEYRRFVLDW